MDYVIQATGDLTASEKLLAKNALSILCSRYPGWNWGIDISGGILSIMCGNLRTQYAMRRLVTECSDQQVLHDGGELLERFRQSRTVYDATALDDAPRTPRGHLKPDM